MSADMTGFGTAELGMATQVLIAQMNQRGEKIRRDEWAFDELEPGKRLGIRINYANREQYIDLLYARSLVHRKTVNLDSTNPQFPTLDDALAELRRLIQPHVRPDASIHRSGE